ncbi:MAG: hypothetical protein QOJ26_1727, partial [Thermoplasmata archaeon]|nr:hypothetical protein [Thermoplasmata archaeon]
MRFQLIAVLVLVAAGLAGCSSGSKGDPLPDDGANDLQVTDTTGGIRGLVVDQAVVPVSGAHVTLTTAAGG